MDERIINLANFNDKSVIRPDDPYYKYDEAAGKLVLLKSSAQSVIDNPGFWEELPDAIKGNVLSWLDSLLSTLNQIVEHRDDGTWLSQNYATTQSQILGYYDSLYLPFVVGVREFRNAVEMTRQELTATLKRVRSAAKEVESKAKTVTDVTNLAADLTSTTSGQQLSDFFTYLVSGFPKQVNDSKGKFRRLGKWLHIQTRASWRDERGYLSSSRLWFIGVLVSIVTTGYVASRALKGIDLSHITLQEVLARALLIAAPAYAIRFCTKNFNANKHLVITNRHRAMVMDTLLAFLSRSEVSDTTREQLIIEAAKQVFEPGESGFLNRRDSIGTNDSVFEFPIQSKV